MTLRACPYMYFKAYSSLYYLSTVCQGHRELHQTFTNVFCSQPASIAYMYFIPVFDLLEVSETELMFLFISQFANLKKYLKPICFILNLRECKVSNLYLCVFIHSHTSFVSVVFMFSSVFFSPLFSMHVLFEMYYINCKLYNILVKIKIILKSQICFQRLHRYCD